MTVTDDFRAARDQLLALRQDYGQARSSFQWPRLEEFNFALDWFDADRRRSGHRAQARRW